MLKYITLLTLIITLCGCASSMQQGALSRAYSNYDHRDYEDVLTLTSQSESYKTPTPELKAEIVFLRAMALEKLGRSDEAQGAFKYLAEQLPDTEYGYRAKEKIKK